MRRGKFELVENFDQGRKKPLTEGAKYGYALLNLGNRNDKDKHGKEMFAVVYRFLVTNHPYDNYCLFSGFVPKKVFLIT